jgi:transcription termination/antitermination protein NusG
MNMQHKRSQFGTADVIEVRDYSEFKQDKAIAANRLRISQLSLASRRIVADYPDMAAWFCLQVKGRSEKIVVSMLNDVDIEAVVPMRIGERIMKRHRIIKGPLIPVLPGYVLVKCVPSAGAMLALRRFDKRVIGVVGGAERPYRIPMKYVTKFIANAVAGEYDHRPPSPLEFDVGEGVRVSDGPFASFPATVTSYDAERNRICVEVNIFGRPTPVDLDVAQIEKV